MKHRGINESTNPKRGEASTFFYSLINQNTIDCVERCFGASPLGAVELSSYPDVSHRATHIQSVPDLFNITTFAGAPRKGKRQKVKGKRRFPFTLYHLLSQRRKTWFLPYFLNKTSLVAENEKNKLKPYYLIIRWKAKGKGQKTLTFRPSPFTLEW